MEGLISVWYTIRGTDKTPVKALDIIMLKGDGSSAGFYVKDDTRVEGYRIIPTGRSLKCYENCIHPDFIRVNQQHIINLNHVLKLAKNHELILKIPTDYHVSVTRTYREAVYRFIGLSKKVA